MHCVMCDSILILHRCQGLGTVTTLLVDRLKQRDVIHTCQVTSAYLPCPRTKTIRLIPGRGTTKYSFVSNVRSSPNIKSEGIQAPVWRSDCWTFSIDLVRMNGRMTCWSGASCVSVRLLVGVLVGSMAFAVRGSGPHCLADGPRKDCGEWLESVWARCVLG